jgi:hypothetical protein
VWGYDGQLPVSLRAPIAVTVEVRAREREQPKRAYRLAWNVGEDGMRLERRAPFEIGRPVAIRFALPDDAGYCLELNAQVRPADGDDDDDSDDDRKEEGGRELTFLSPSEDDRRLLRRYVTDRLGLPESLS